jgi:hypothetical protein
MSMNRVVLAIIVLAFVSAGCDLCSDETVSSAPSPDGRLVAVITERDCGATTDFVRTVNLEPGSNSGPYIKARLILSNKLFRGNGRHIVALKWQDASHLKIVHDVLLTDADIFYRTSGKMGIKVSLETLR